MTTAPTFSVLAWVGASTAAHAQSCFQSIRRQTRGDWELLILDDSAQVSGAGEVINQAVAKDARIRVLRQGGLDGTASLGNEAIAAATGQFLCFIDADAELVPGALAGLASPLARRPDADLLYSNEVGVADDDEAHITFHKPDWSPGRLRSQPYVGHLTALRRSLVQSIGGLRPGFEGALEYDLILRVSELCRHIIHVPEVLYRGRHRLARTPGNVASVGGPGPASAGCRAVSDQCGRLGLNASVESVGRDIQRVRRHIDGNPLVSIIVPTRGSAAVIEGRFRTLVLGAAQSIVTSSTYENYEMVIVADTGIPSEVADELKQILGHRLTLVSYERPFNFSDKINVGALAAAGDYLLLLNDDVEIISPDWIESLLSPAQDPDVGMVGGMLYFADGSVQHGGHCYVHGSPTHVGFRAAHDEPGPARGLRVEREASGVTAACALLPRTAFFDVGGMCMLLPNNYNDVDLCLKIRSSGRRIVWTPYAELFHYESKTRESSVAAWEWTQLERRWKSRLVEDAYWPAEDDASELDKR